MTDKEKYIHFLNSRKEKYENLIPFIERIPDKEFEQWLTAVAGYIKEHKLLPDLK